MPRGSRGGGSRGGGSHSRSRSSHHRYGRRRRYRYQSSSPICNCCFCFVFIGSLALVGGFLLFLPRTNITNITLSPSETYMVETKLTANYVTVDAEEGIDSHYFNEEPPLSKIIDYTEHDSFNIPFEYFEFVTYYMKAGTTFTLNFTSSSGERIDFYLIKGENQYNNFIDSENSHSSVEELYVSDYSNFEYTCTKSDRYYLIWENYDFPTVLNYSIDITFSEYDVSEAMAIQTGDYRLDAVTYPIIIFKNMLNDTDLYLRVEVELPPIIQNPIPVVGGVLAIIIICGICIARGIKKPNKIQSHAAMKSQRSFDPSLYGHTTNMALSGSEQTYKTQLPDKCISCSGILDEDSQKALLMDGFVFCKFCGSKITQ